MASPAITIPTFACAPETDAQLCELHRRACGPLTVVDRCGEERRVACARCVEGSFCDQERAECTSCGAIDSVCTRAGESLCGTLTAAAESRLAQCGLPALGCGGCSGGKACVLNRCVCPVLDEAQECAVRGLQCGLHSVLDACGAPTQLQCGLCADGQLCTPQGQCPGDCVPEGDALFCARLDKACGRVLGVDNCQQPRTAECGSCGPGQTCTDQNTCACPPHTCTASCGTELDACGGAVRCGTACAQGSWCKQGACACQPETDAQLCAQGPAGCGQRQARDRCGQERTVWCGCEAPALCLQNTCTTSVVLPPPQGAGETPRFGSSVSVDRGRFVVGAPGLWDFDRAQVPAFGSGAWVYAIDAQTGAIGKPEALRDKLLAQDVVVAGEHFGGAVSLSGDHVMVGSPLDDYFLRPPQATALGQVFMFRATGAPEASWEFVGRSGRVDILGALGYSVDVLALGEMFEFGTALVGAPFSGVQDAQKNFENVGTALGLFFVPQRNFWNLNSTPLTTALETNRQNSAIGAAVRMTKHWALVARPGRNEVVLYGRQSFFAPWQRAHVLAQSSGLAGFYYGAHVAISPSGRHMAIGRGVLPHERGGPASGYAHSVSIYENMAHARRPVPTALDESQVRFVAQFSSLSEGDRFGASLAFDTDALYVGAPGAQGGRGGGAPGGAWGRWGVEAR